MSQQQAYDYDQLMYMQEAERLLVQATRRPLTLQEVRLLAYVSGLQFNETKEKNNAVQR